MFFDAHVGPFRMAAEGGEHRHFGIEAKRVIAPLAGGDHAPVEVEDAGPFQAVKSGNGAPVPRWRERRDDAQALFALGWSPTLRLARNSLISRSSSHNRASTGSAISLHGVP